MSGLSFTVLGVPVPQPRPRARAIGRFAHVYHDKRHPVNAWRTLVRCAAVDAMAGRAAMQGPLLLMLEFRLPRPAAHFTSKRTLRGSSPYWHTGRADGDNLSKAVADAMTSAGVWGDDSQVCQWAITKRYVKDEEQPGAAVSVYPLPFRPLDLSPLACTQQQNPTTAPGGGTSPQEHPSGAAPLSQ